MKILIKSIVATLATMAIVSGSSYALKTIDSVKSQTIQSGDLMMMGWFQQVNDQLPPVGGVSGDVLAIGADGKPHWVCEQGTAGCGGTAPVAAPTFACTGTVPSQHVAKSNDTGLTANSAWQNAVSGNKCYYACTDGYSGTDCGTAPAVQPNYCAAGNTISCILQK